MLNFPNSPAVNDQFVAAGTTYAWNGQGWVAVPPLSPPVDSYTKAEADSRFVNAATDTMSGPLTVNGMVTSTVGYLAKPGAPNSFVASNAAGDLTASFGIDAGGSAYYNINNSAQTYIWNISGVQRLSMNNTGLYLIQGVSGYAIDVRPIAGAGSIASLIGWCPGIVYYAMVGGFVSGGNYSIYGTTTAFLTAGTWSTSDARLKRTIADLDSEAALQQVNAVPVRRFAPSSPMAAGMLYGDGAPEELFGWLADDVENVVPLAVKDIGVPPEDMNARAALMGLARAPASDSTEGYDLANAPLTIKAINDHYMIAVLWSAVQRLSYKVAQLEAAANPVTKEN